MLHNLVYLLLLLTTIPPAHQKNIFTVSRISPSTISVDGKLENRWLQTDSITTFISPWKNTTAGPTTFRAAHDSSYFYFIFTVSDSKVIAPTDAEEASVTKGDRIELFFSADSSLATYYCFEIAPNGLIYDYRATLHRNFFPEWQSSGVNIKSNIHSSGYTIEGAIPKLFFETFINERGFEADSIYAGVFRAERNFSSASEEDFTWLSWIKPNATQPDFHIPSAMGIFKFE
jgi:chondroitin AC lyase